MRIYGYAFLCLVIIIIICLIVIVLHSFFTEWTLRPKSFEMDYSITSNEMKIFDIESEVRKLVLDKYPNSYLGTIMLSNISYDANKHLSCGELEFVYCQKLKENIIYNYERYLLCSVSVDIKEKKIVNMVTYGNNQIGGLTEMTSYPEIEEIDEAINKYCDVTMLIDKPYYIEKIYMHLYYYGSTNVTFTLSNHNKVDKIVKGVLKMYDGKYVFHVTQRDGSLVLTK